MSNLRSRRHREPARDLGYGLSAPGTDVPRGRWNRLARRVGDACEESRDALIQLAVDLARLGVPVFILQEGHDPRVERIFQEIAQITKGAHLRFNTGAAAQLAELLRDIALFAVAGSTALENHSGAAQLLLGQMRR